MMKKKRPHWTTVQCIEEWGKRASQLASQHRSEVRTARKAARTAIDEGSARAASSSSQGISRVARNSLRPPLPEWVHKSDASHHLLWIGGFLTCSSCAATSSVAVQSKSRFYGPCRGTFPSGSLGKLRRLRQGLLPHQVTAWPDDLREPEDLAVPTPLIHRDGRFAYLDYFLQSPSAA